MEKFKDLKEFFNDRLDRVESKLDDKCDKCAHVSAFNVMFSNHWVHILALWASVVGLGAYFYQHVAK
jgi:hypothetical protein